MRRQGRSMTSASRELPTTRLKVRCAPEGCCGETLMKSIGRAEATLMGVFLASIAVGSQSSRFEPVQKDLFAAGGAFVNAWADIDGDADLDRFVGFDGTPNRLYRNDRGTFADAAASAGIGDARPTRAAAWGDADADGDPDLLVGFTPNPGGSVLRLY